MKLKSTVAAALLAVFGAGSANAANTDWFLHDYPNAEIGFNIVTGGFWDNYSFSMPVGFNLVAGVAVANNNGNVILINNGQFALYSNADNIIGNGDDALISPWWAYNGSTGATQHSVNLTAGNYYYAVKGVGAGIGEQGLYTLTSQITPVPEPETYALMLAGLAAVGFIARRRSSKA